MAVMFLGSLKLAPGRFKEAIFRPKLIGLSLMSVFALAPLLSLGIAQILGLDQDSDRLAVLICSAQASTLATGIVLTEVAGGDVALAMVITVFNNLVAVAATPLVFRVLGNSSVAVDYAAMILEMSAKILLPVIVAQALRRWIVDWTKRHSRQLSITSQLIILCFIYMGVVAGSQKLVGGGLLFLNVIILVLLFHPLMLVANALIARFATNDPGSRAAFVLCSSQKTLPAAILIWTGYFPALPLGPVVAVAYHVLQLIADSMLAPGFSKLPLIRDKKASNPA
jgi:sodium/bile acid cotransporter 7